MIALGMESVLVSGVVDGVGLSIVTDVAVLSPDEDGLTAITVFVGDILEMSLFLFATSVGQLEIVSIALRQTNIVVFGLSNNNNILLSLSWGSNSYGRDGSKNNDLNK